MSQYSPWSTRQFYSKAWSITLKHKKLWIIALAITAGTSSNSFSSSGSNHSSPQKSPSSQHSPLPSSSPANLTQNTPTTPPDSPSLLEPITLFESTTWPQIRNTLSRVPPTTYILLALQLGVIFIFFITLSMYGQGWAVATMIQATADTTDHDQLSLHSASLKGITKVKSLIWLNIFPSLAFVLVSILTAAITAIILAIIKNTLLTILIIIIGIPTWIYFLISISLSLIFAPRHAVLQDLPAKKAFIQAYHSIHQLKLKMLGLGLTNFLASTAIFLIAASPFIGIVLLTLWPIIKSGQFNPAMLILLIPVFLILLPLMITLSAIIRTFKFVIWYQAYQVATSQHHEAQA